MPRSSAKRPKSSEPIQIPWPRILKEAQTRFGIRRFRTGQREVLESVFRGQNTLALMPTGAGKSLTYQLPALFLPRPVVVVSPLIALMQDQQQKAADADVVVEKLDSTLTQGDAAHARLEIANHSAQLIYVTPERLETPAFLEQLKAAGGISLLVVDEAHTIAQWGHDFRPAFLAIGAARKTLGNPPVLALTATATGEVITEILQSLHAEDAAIINTGIERPNLFFSVHPTVNNAAKCARILAMLQSEEGTGIIYTASVRSANELFEFFTEHGISVAHYHGKMPTRERVRVQQEFMRGDHKVMIATKAFGLGIDKPDIRFVFHFEFPDSLETYYQEAGRAGRDGDPARAALLYRLEDKRIQSFFLAGRYPHLSELEAVYRALAGRVVTEVSTEVAASPAELTQSLADAASSHARSSVAQPALAQDPAPNRLVSVPAEVPAPVDLPAENPLLEAGSKPVVTALTVAAESGVGLRRTQVILNLLRDAGLIRRGRRGYVLATAQPPANEIFEGLLHTYTDRAVRDKDRLAEMMHYAETPNCRTQIVRAYFSESEGEPCLRCDNCALKYPDDVAPATRELFEIAGRKPSGSVDLAASSVADAPQREAVTTVETAYGTLHTTAPETLLQPEPEPAFRKGDAVRHKRFGAGTVLDAYNGTILVDFLKGGSKRLRADFLEAA